MKKWISIVIILAILFISNFNPVKAIFSNTIDERHYKYSTGDGGFTFAEFKSREVPMMYRKYDTYKERFPHKDSTMYRLFSKNILCFWRWRDYIYDERYELPFIKWKVILKKRGPIEHSNPMQDF